MAASENDWHLPPLQSESRRIPAPKSAGNPALPASSLARHSESRQDARVKQRKPTRNKSFSRHIKLKSIDKPHPVQTNPHGTISSGQSHGSDAPSRELPGKSTYSDDVEKLIREVKSRPNLNNRDNSAINRDAPLRDSSDSLKVDAASMVNWSEISAQSNVVFADRVTGLKYFQAAVRGRMARRLVLKLRALGTIVNFLRLLVKYRHSYLQSGTERDVCMTFRVYVLADICMKDIASSLEKAQFAMLRKVLSERSRSRLEAATMIQQFVKHCRSKVAATALWAFIRVAEKARAAKAEEARRTSDAFRSHQLRRRQQKRGAARIQHWFHRLSVQRENIERQRQVLVLIDAEDPKLSQICEFHHDLLNIQLAHSGMTALSYAVRHEKFDSLRRLLSARADCTVRDKVGRTPLMLAVLSNSTQCLDMLLKKAYSRRPVDMQCWMQFDLPSGSLHMGLNEVSIGGIVRENKARFRGTCFHAAAHVQCHSKILLRLISHQKSITAGNERDRKRAGSLGPRARNSFRTSEPGISHASTNPVHIACYSGNRSALVALLRAKLFHDIDNEDNVGKTPTQILCEAQDDGPQRIPWQSRKAMLSSLLAAKATLRRECSQKILIDAIFHRDSAFLRTMLSAKADPNVKCLTLGQAPRDSNTGQQWQFCHSEELPIMFALAYSASRPSLLARNCIDALVRNTSTKVNVRGKHEWTPLQIAVVCGERQIIRLLVTRRAKITRCPWRDGSYSEFMIAAFLQDWDTFDELRRSMSNSSFERSIGDARNADNEDVEHMLRRLFGVQSLSHVRRIVAMHRDDIISGDVCPLSESVIRSIIMTPHASQEVDVVSKEDVFAGRTVAFARSVLLEAVDVDWSDLVPKTSSIHVVVSVVLIKRAICFVYRSTLTGRKGFCGTFLHRDEFFFILQLELVRALTVCRQYRVDNLATLRQAQHEETLSTKAGRKRRKADTGTPVPRYVLAMFQRLSVVDDIVSTALRQKSLLRLAASERAARVVEQQQQIQKRIMAEAAMREAELQNQERIKMAVEEGEQRLLAMIEAQEAEKERKLQLHERERTSAALLLQARGRGMLARKNARQRKEFVARQQLQQVQQAEAAKAIAKKLAEEAEREEALSKLAKQREEQLASKARYQHEQEMALEKRQRAARIGALDEAKSQLEDGLRQIFDLRNSNDDVRSQVARREADCLEDVTLLRKEVAQRFGILQRHLTAGFGDLSHKNPAAGSVVDSHAIGVESKSDDETDHDIDALNGGVSDRLTQQLADELQHLAAEEPQKLPTAVRKLSQDGHLDAVLEFQRQRQEKLVKWLAIMRVIRIGRGFLARLRVRRLRASQRPSELEDSNTKLETNACSKEHDQEDLASLTIPSEYNSRSLHRHFEAADRTALESAVVHKLSAAEMRLQFHHFAKLELFKELRAVLRSADAVEKSFRRIEARMTSDTIAALQSENLSGESFSDALFPLLEVCSRLRTRQRDIVAKYTQTLTALTSVESNDHDSSSGHEDSTLSSPQVSQHPSPGAAMALRVCASLRDNNFEQACKFVAGCNFSHAKQLLLCPVDSSGTNLETDAHGTRLIHVAAEVGDLQCVKKICQLAAKHKCVNKMLASLSSMKETPLYVAIRSGHEQCAQLLLDLGGVNVANGLSTREYITPVQASIATSMTALTRSLLTRKAHVSRWMPNRFVARFAKDVPVSPLMYACRSGDISMIKLLVDFASHSQVDVNEDLSNDDIGESDFVEASATLFRNYCVKLEEVEALGQCGSSLNIEVNFLIDAWVQFLIHRFGAAPLNAIASKVHECIQCAVGDGLGERRDEKNVTVSHVVTCSSFLLRGSHDCTDRAPVGSKNELQQWTSIFRHTCTSTDDDGPFSVMMMVSVRFPHRDIEAYVDSLVDGIQGRLNNITLPHLSCPIVPHGHSDANDLSSPNAARNWCSRGVKVKHIGTSRSSALLSNDTISALEQQCRIALDAAFTAHGVASDKASLALGEARALALTTVTKTKQVEPFSWTTTGVGVSDVALEFSLNQLLRHESTIMHKSPVDRSNSTESDGSIPTAAMLRVVIKLAILEQCWHILEFHRSESTLFDALWLARDSSKDVSQKIVRCAQRLGINDYCDPFGNTVVALAAQAGRWDPCRELLKMHAASGTTLSLLTALPRACFAEVPLVVGDIFGYLLEGASAAEVSWALVKAAASGNDALLKYIASNVNSREAVICTHVAQHSKHPSSITSRTTTASEPCVLAAMGQAMRFHHIQAADIVFTTFIQSKLVDPCISPFVLLQSLRHDCQEVVSFVIREQPSVLTKHFSWLLPQCVQFSCNSAVRRAILFFGSRKQLPVDSTVLHECVLHAIRVCDFQLTQLLLFTFIAPLCSPELSFSQFGCQFPALSEEGTIAPTVVPFKNAFINMHGLFLVDLFRVESVVDDHDPAFKSAFEHHFAPLLKGHIVGATSSAQDVKNNFGVPDFHVNAFLASLRHSVHSWLSRGALHDRCVQANKSIEAFDEIVDVVVQNILHEVRVTLRHSHSFFSKVNDVLFEAMRRFDVADRFQRRIQREDEQLLFAMLQQFPRAKVSRSTRDDVAINQVAEFMNRRNVSAECLNERKETPLLVAASNGNVSLVKHFIETLRANELVRSIDGDDLLMKAVLANSVTTLRYLLKRPGLHDQLVLSGSGKSGVDDKCDNAFHTAVRCHKQQQILELLLSDIELLSIEDCPGLNHTGRCGLAPLHLAVLANAQRAVDLILKCNACIVNVISSNSGVTPLYLACHSANIRLVKKLLSCGGNASFSRTPRLQSMGLAASSFSDSCLFWACQAGQTSIVDLLLANGARLWHFKQNGRDVDEISERRAPRQAKGYRKYLEFSPLYFAAFMGDFDVLKRLLDSSHEVELSASGPNGETLEALLHRIHDASIDEAMVRARGLESGPRQVRTLDLADIKSSSTTVGLVTELGPSAHYGREAKERAETVYFEVFGRSTKVRRADVKMMLEKSQTICSRYNSRKGDLLSFIDAVFHRLDQRSRADGFSAHVIHDACHRFLPDIIFDLNANKAAQLAQQVTAVAEEKDLFVAESYQLMEQAKIALGTVSNVSHKAQMDSGVISMSDHKGRTELAIANNTIADFDVRGADLRNVRALFAAIKSDKSSTVRDLITRRRVSVSSLDDRGRSPLHLAVASNAPECARTLLSLKANVDSVNTQTGQSPLMCAAATMNLEMVKILVEEGGCNIHFAVPVQQLRPQQQEYVVTQGNNDSSGMVTAAHFAQYAAKSATVQDEARELLEYFESLPPAMSDESVATASAQDGEAGVDVLMEKVRSTEMLREAAASSALIEAALSGNTSVLSDLLQMPSAGAESSSKVRINVDATDHNGETALIHATRAGKHDVVSMLLRAKANPASVDKTRQTSPLHIAAGRGDLVCVQALVQALDLEVHLIDTVAEINSGESPLAVAAGCGQSHQRHCGDVVSVRNYLDVCRFLLLHGARLSHDDGSALWNACASNNVEVVLLFREKCAGDEFCSLAKKHFRGLSSLHVAIKRGFQNIVEVLVDAGCDLEHRADVQQELLCPGFTPLQISIFRSYHGIAKLLLLSGARCLSEVCFPTSVMCGLDRTIAVEDPNTKNSEIDEVDFCVFTGDFFMLSLLLKIPSNSISATRRVKVEKTFLRLYRVPLEFALKLADELHADASHAASLGDASTWVVPSGFPTFTELDNIPAALQILQQCGVAGYFGNPRTKALCMLTTQRLVALPVSRGSCGDNSQEMDNSTLRHNYCVQWILGSYSLVKKGAQEQVSQANVVCGSPP